MFDFHLQKKKRFEFNIFYDMKNWMSIELYASYFLT
jgi:hypothetical protein